MGRVALKKREFTPEEIRVMELVGQLLVELEKLGYVKGKTADNIARKFLKTEESDL